MERFRHRKAKASYDQEVYLQVQKENHGLIFIPRDMNEFWVIKGERFDTITKKCEKKAGNRDDNHRRENK